MRDSIYQSLRRAILACEFRPGQELREHALAQQFQVSATPVRDALLHLEKENLVAVMPRRGYLVKPITPADVENIFGLHVLIDAACAAAAARAASQDLLVLDRFRHLPNAQQSHSEFIEQNRIFHNTIAALSRNGRMGNVAQDLNDHIDRLMRLSLRMFGEQQMRAACAEHETMIDAIQARDPERAARVSREHAASAQGYIRAALTAAQ